MTDYLVVHSTSLRTVEHTVRRIVDVTSNSNAEPSTLCDPAYVGRLDKTAPFAPKPSGFK